MSPLRTIKYHTTNVLLSPQGFYTTLQRKRGQKNRQFLLLCCVQAVQHEKIQESHNVTPNPCSVTYQPYESFGNKSFPSLFFSFFIQNKETKIPIDYNISWSVVVTVGEIKVRKSQREVKPNGTKSMGQINYNICHQSLIHNRHLINNGYD